MARSNVPQPVRDAAERLVANLLAQPDLVAMVAQAEIQRQVNAGALIPLSRLQMGPGLELAPIGRIAALEEAIAEALGVLDDEAIGSQNAINGAHALLRAVAAPPTTGPAPAVVPDESARAAPEQATNEPADPEPDDDEDKAHWLAKRGFNGGGDGKPLAKEPDGRPTDMPTESRRCDADGCDKDVTASEGQMSFTRFRKVLCREHFVSYKTVPV